MSEVSLRSRMGTGGYLLVVDGVDLSNNVAEIVIRVNNREAVVDLTVPATVLALDLDDAEVRSNPKAEVEKTYPEPPKPSTST